MLDAYIIEKIKKEKEEKEQTWQPLPLELPVKEDTEEDDRQQEEKKKNEQKTIRIRF